jgi:hypothetical protein
MEVIREFVSTGWLIMVTPEPTCEVNFGPRACEKCGHVVMRINMGSTSEDGVVIRGQTAGQIQRWDGRFGPGSGQCPCAWGSVHAGPTYIHRLLDMYIPQYEEAGTALKYWTLDNR